jgi:hypothetical protein
MESSQPAIPSFFEGANRNVNREREKKASKSDLSIGIRLPGLA